MEMKMSERLDDIAQQMVLPGQGILAADESTGTIKRFDDNLASTERSDVTIAKCFPCR